LLVFSNSCQAGVTAVWQEGYRAEGQAFGIGSAFLLAGVRNYVGTLWAVQDEESFLFATAFYRNLTAGAILGEALRAARQTVISQRGLPNLTWANYLLYGDPACTVLPTTQGHPLPSGSAVAPFQPVGVLQRKLAAILSADVKGYSRLMGEDEEATIRTLTAYREVMSTLIQQHRGRVVDAPGDNLLAEFASAVDAVRCAVQMQQELKTRNAELPHSRRMEFRMGINVGDVVVEGEKLYGDGVNIAARLEGLAEPGGVCIAGTVHDQIENKLALNYEYLGEQTVKNIAKPVRVYRVLPSIPSTSSVASSQHSVVSSSEQSQVQDPAFSVQRPVAAPVLPTPYILHPTPTLVGRETELAQLHRWFERAVQGERQVVFVTGEPGIGKTTLVEAFLHSLASEGRIPRSPTVQTLDPRHHPFQRGT
jgi:adenylate cyclase